MSEYKTYEEAIEADPWCAEVVVSKRTGIFYCAYTSATDVGLYDRVGNMLNMDIFKVVERPTTEEPKTPILPQEMTTTVQFKALVTAFREELSESVKAGQTAELKHTKAMLDAGERAQVLLQALREKDAKIAELEKALPTTKELLLDNGASNTKRPTTPTPVAPERPKSTSFNPCLWP